MLSPGGTRSPHQRWPVLQGAHASSGVNHSKLQNYCSEFLNGTRTLSNAKVGEGEMYMQFVPEPLPGGQVGAQLNLSPGFLANKCLRCSQSPGSSNGPQELIGSKEVTFLKLGGSSRSKKTHGSKHFGQQRDHGSQGIKRQDKLVIHLWAFNLALKAATQGGSKVLSKLETSLVGKVSLRAVLSPQSFLLCTGELSNSIAFILLLFFQLQRLRLDVRAVSAVLAAVRSLQLLLWLRDCQT